MKANKTNIKDLVHKSIKAAHREATKGLDTTTKVVRSKKAYTRKNYRLEY